MAAIAVALLAVKLPSDDKARPIAWRDLSLEVGQLTIAGQEQRLFRDREQLGRYLARAQATDSAPSIDFSRRQALLVSPGPRSSTGYDVEVLSVTARDGKISIRVSERSPSREDRVEARVTYPYRLLSLPAGQDVYVDWVGR